jgi:hypothetical protein
VNAAEPRRSSSTSSTRDPDHNRRGRLDRRWHRPDHIYPTPCRDWTAVDRVRLAKFFAARYCERFATTTTETPGGGR